MYTVFVTMGWDQMVTIQSGTLHSIDGELIGGPEIGITLPESN